MGVDPVTMMMIAGAVQGGASALGGIQEKQQLDQQASQLSTAYGLSSRRSEREQRAFRGSQISAVAGSGVELSGSALDVINESMFEFELDQAIAKEDFRLQRASLKAQGRQALVGGFMGAASAGLGAAEKMSVYGAGKGELAKKTLPQGRPAGSRSFTG